MRLILSILMLIASVAGFIMFIVPTYNTIKELRVQENDYNTILDNARTLQEQSAKLATKYNSFDPALIQKLDTMLPNNPENVQLILELDAIAGQYGLALQNVKIEEAEVAAARPGAPAQNTEVGTLNINFTLAGPYNGFTNFLRAVESSLRMVDIAKVSFTALDTQSQNYQYSVGIKTYWLK